MSPRATYTRITCSACSCLFLLVLLGCKTIDEAQTAPLISTTPEGHAEELAPIELADGECGLFVWIGESPRFLLFTQDISKARYWEGGREIVLHPTSKAPKADMFGQVPVQTFISPQKEVYELSFKTADIMGATIRYGAGNWASQTAEGWKRVQRAIGLSGCVSENSDPPISSLNVDQATLLSPLSGVLDNAPRGLITKQEFDQIQTRVKIRDVLASQQMRHPKTPPDLPSDETFQLKVVNSISVREPQTPPRPLIQCLRRMRSALHPRI